MTEKRQDESYFLSEQIRDQQELQHRSCNGPGDFFHSNEGNIHVFFKQLKGFRGSIFGIGSDQILDLLAGSDLTSALLVDYAPSNHLTIRSLLEVGAAHHKTHAFYPTPEQFVDYFSPGNNEELMGTLSTIYDPEELKKALAIFKRGIPFFGQVVSYSDYMKAKIRLQEDTGDSAAWYGTPGKLAKVLHAYENNRVALSLSDLMNKDHMNDVANFAKKRGFEFDIFYLSDIEQYKENADIWDNLDMLSVGSDVRILKTESDINSPLGDVAQDPILKRIALPYMYVITTYENRRAVPHLTSGYSLAQGPTKNLSFLFKT